MFCGKCGVQNQDGAAFCKACGAPLNAQQTPAAQPPVSQQTQQVYVPQQNNGTMPQQTPSFQPAYGGAQVAAPAADHGKFRKIGIGVVAGVVVVAVVLVLVFMLGNGGGYKAPINKFFHGIQHGDVGEMIDSFATDKMMKVIKKETGMSRRELESQFESQMLSGLGSILGDSGLSGKGKWDLSDYLKYKIGDAEDLDKDELEYVQDEYEDFDEKVTAAKKVEVTASITIMGITQEQEMELQVVQIGGKWYVNPEAISGLW